MRKRKVLAVFMAIAMVFCYVPATAVADSTPGAFQDMPQEGFWSTAALEAAVDNGLLNGFVEKDGTYIKPNDPLTRAQMAAIVNRAFGAENKATLTGVADVASNAWYLGDVQKAVQMGTMKLDTLMRPNDTITRQEAFTILARAFKMTDGTATDLAGFSDGSKVASWAVPGMGALVKAGYVQGSDNTLTPTAQMTRAQFAVIMNNMIQDYITQAGTVTAVASGNVMVNVPGVTLKDVTIQGDLIVGDGVGDGDVTLDNVTIKGDLIARGGGVNSIIIVGGGVDGKIVIAKVDGQVRVSVEGGAEVEVIVIDDGKDDVIIEGTVGTVEVTAPDTPVIVQNATVTNIEIKSAGAANVTVASNSTVTNVVVGTGSTGTTLNVEGRVTNVETSAANTNVGGTGTVTTVTTNEGANNTSVTTPSTKVNNDGATGVTAGGGTEVPSGSTATNSNTGGEATVVTTPTDGGSSDRGSGSGDTVVNVSAISVDQTTLTLTAGGATATITATVLPANATNKNVTWTSSDESVATVTNGVVTPVTMGAVTITASTVDGGKTATASVVVFGEKDVLNATQVKEYDTIQAAIDVAASGDTILVGSGTYVEEGQIVIDKNLTIQGIDNVTTIIKPSANTGSSGDARGWFLVNSDVEFNLSNVTLDGEGFNIRQAIRSNGSGTIENNIFKNIKDSSYYGWGVAVMGDPMTITGNDFLDIERIGVHVYGTTASGSSVINNTFVGNGDGDYLQYGIEVNGGATDVLIDGNTFSSFGTSTTDWGSAAVLVDNAYGGEASSSAIISNNSFEGNEMAIAIGYQEDQSDATITGNTFTDNSWHVDSDSGIEIDLDSVISNNTFNNEVIVNVSTKSIRDKEDVSVVNETQNKGYNTIQAAIDAAIAGDTILVGPGTYEEQLEINKPLTLLGPNADIAGYSEDRVNEAIITYPAEMDTTSENLVYGAADSISINGFTFINEQETADVSYREIWFTGYNYNFSNNYVISYADKIAVHFGTNNQTPEPNDNTIVKDNYIESTSSWASLYLQGRGGTVEGNMINGGIMALQIQPYANSGSGTVYNNTLSGYDTGIWHNFATKGSGTWIYELNDISAKEPTNTYRWSPKYWRGITITTYGTTGSGNDPHTIFLNNSINGEDASVGETWEEVIGIHFNANISNTATFEFTDNTIQNVTLGVYRAVGQADLDSILANNTFPEGFNVLGNQIKMLEDGKIYISNTGVEYATIQAAIDAATAGDTILLGSGEYKIPWNGTVGLKLYKSLNIIGEDENSVVIRPETKGTPTTHRLIQTGYDQPAAVTLKNITIDGNLTDGSNGGVSRGISVYNYGAGLGSSLSLENVTIQNIIDDSVHDTTGLYFLTGGNATSSIKNVTIKNYGWTGVLIGSLVGDGDQIINIDGLHIDGRNDKNYLTNGLDIRGSSYRNLTIDANHVYIENCDYIDDNWEAFAILVSPEAGHYGSEDVCVSLSLENSIITNSANALHFESSGRADNINVQYTIFDLIANLDLVWFGPESVLSPSLTVNQSYSDREGPINYLISSEDLDSENIGYDPIIYPPEITNSFNNAEYPTSDFGKDTMSFTLSNIYN